MKDISYPEKYNSYLHRRMAANRKLVLAIALSCHLLSVNAERLNSTAVTGSLGDALCPPWFIPNNSSTGPPCVCSNTLKEVVKCDEDAQESSLAVGYCMTHDNSSGSTVVGRCPYTVYSVYHNVGDAYFPLPPNVSKLNDKICGPMNRTGKLCGKCKSRSGAAMLSNKIVGVMQCGTCYTTWAVYLAADLLLTTVLYAAVAIANVKVASSPMITYVLFCQVVVNLVKYMNSSALLSYTTNDTTGTLLQVWLAFYGIWNLDFLFGSPFLCVNSTLQSMAFQYTLAFYPLLLFGVLFIRNVLQSYSYGPRYRWLKCILCLCDWRRYSGKGLIHNSVVSFFLLSYTKILFVSINLLLPTHLYDIEGHDNGTMLFYDTTITYFGIDHLPYAIPAMLILVVFIFLPPIFLILYPTRIFTLCFNYCTCSHRWYILHILADNFQGYYKFGIGGSYDFRSVSALHFLLRIAVAVSVAVSSVIVVPSSAYVSLTWFVPGTMFVAAGLFFGLVRPYRFNYMNILDSLLLVLIGMLFFLMSSREGYILALPLGALPLVFFVAYILYKVLKWMWTKCKSCIRPGVRRTQLLEEDSPFDIQEESLYVDYSPSPPAVRRPLLADDDNTSSSDASIKQEHGHTTQARVSPVSYGSVEN